MGVDEDSVVDPSLNVRGVDGLRVIDASVMPAIIGGNTNAVAIMIGEKGRRSGQGSHRLEPPLLPGSHAGDTLHQVVGVLATSVEGAAGEPLPEFVDQAGRHRVILAKHRPDDLVDRILMRTEVHLAVDRQTVRGVEARFGSSRQFLRQLELIAHIPRVAPCR